MPTSALSAIRRSGQALCEQISEAAALTCGTAYYSTRFPGLGAANQVRDAFLPEGASPQSAYDEVRSFYAEKGLRCGEWAPSIDRPVAPLTDVLATRGYRPEPMAVMVLSHDSEPMAGAVVPPAVQPPVRILPARAVRNFFRETVAAKPSELREQMADLAVERMDDPQYDMYVAMLDGQPVGHGGLLQVGDIGRVDDLFVLEPMRGKGVGSALMAYLVGMSRRLALRITVLEFPAGSPAERFCKHFGFEPAGEYVKWVVGPMPSSTLHPAT